VLQAPKPGGLQQQRLPIEPFAGGQPFPLGGGGGEGLDVRAQRTAGDRRRDCGFGVGYRERGAGLTETRTGIRIGIGKPKTNTRFAPHVHQICTTWPPSTRRNPQQTTPTRSAPHFHQIGITWPPNT